MRTHRRYQLEGPSTRRPVDPAADDFQHLMECVDTDCWYCSDRAEPKTERDPEVQAWLDALAAAGELPAAA